jgi:ABC-type sugar transport system ATPase subunit
MAFQYPALLPQLTVQQNIGLGPKLRHIPKTEATQRVRELAHLLNLKHLLDRLPESLSGGEQQRVSLARALANQPSVLLLDEPLANLDAVSRMELREAIRAIQQRLRLTTIYVTHDQLEAAAVSDRVALLNRGRLEQAGTARELYSDPENLFVAQFFGPDQPNVLDGELREGRFHVGTSDWSFPVETTANSHATCLLRTRAIQFGSTYPAKVNSVQHTGWSTIATLEWHGITLRAELDPLIDPPPSGTFHFDLPKSGLLFFDGSGKRIRN